MKDALRQEVLRLCRRPVLTGLQEVVDHQAGKFGCLEEAQAASKDGRMRISLHDNVADLVDWLISKYGSAEAAIRGIHEGKLVLYNQDPKRTWLQEALKP